MRLTRLSYRRKIIVFGIAIFLSIAMIATGFATWVMSANARDDSKGGNVDVGTVSDSNLEITNVVISSTSFYFEPLASDNQGRVRNDGSHYESLSITVTGDISPSAYIGSATIQLNVSSGVTAAATAGYIVLPDCASSAQTLTLTDKAGVEGTKTFTYVITFEWGSLFNGMNPGLYYDSDSDGILVSNADVANTIKAMRTAIYGSDEPSTPDPVFKIVISANAN